MAENPEHWSNKRWQREYERWRAKHPIHLASLSSFKHRIKRVEREKQENK